MWTDETRARHDRRKLRYPRDLTDDEWSLIAPLIPPDRRGRRERQRDARELANRIMYVLSPICQWRHIPKALPPKSTLHDYLDLCNYGGAPSKIDHTLDMLCREQVTAPCQSQPDLTQTACGKPGAAQSRTTAPQDHTPGTGSRRQPRRGPPGLTRGTICRQDGSGARRQARRRLPKTLAGLDSKGDSLQTADTRAPEPGPGCRGRDAR